MELVFCLTESRLSGTIFWSHILARGSLVVKDRGSHEWGPYLFFWSKCRPLSQGTSRRISHVLQNRSGFAKDKHNEALLYEGCITHGIRQLVRRGASSFH